MADMKHLQLTDDLHRYVVEHGTPPDEIQQGLIEVTAEKVRPWSMMQIAPEQGSFLTFLVGALGAKQAIEIGTFTGYSALCIARGLADGGRLVCCDVSDEWTAIGRPFWERAGVADRIDLRIAPALDTLAALPQEPTFDFAFIDADKTNYANYLDALMPLLTERAVVAVDNVLWSGRVVDGEATDDDTVAIKAFNDAVVADDRFEQTMLPLSDGVTLLRVRS